MYICMCNAVTDHAIRRHAAEGVATFAELQARTGCSDCCGACEPEARQCLREAVASQPAVLGFLPVTA
ncbi:(2Fe-2S)-binding protein [Luteibacter yeojuensis]|uniref:Bacterioferritin-associated ferredoxin n=1 Tax=Luteibacter yeojuensis TaxID=345309 RepID=A0A0F3KVV8_9GAMM|nr:(2Fe-2S)-binding protein [Luteibacter yeojuensis]KJV35296.1 (2Fe-2S)-binding protein [Luteibacter yeojuensis]